MKQKKCITNVKIHIFLMQTINPSLLASYLFFFLSGSR